MVLSWLTSSLTPPIMHVVIKCISVVKAWKALQERYAPSSHNRVIQLRGELLNLRLNDLHIADFLDKINTLADQLALSVLEALLLSAETCHLTFTLSGDTHVPAITAMVVHRGCKITASGGFVRGGGRLGAPHGGPPNPTYPNAPAGSHQGCPNEGLLGAVIVSQLLLPQSSRVPSAPTAPTSWLLYFGANTHIINDLGQLTNVQEYMGTNHVNGVNGGQGYPLGGDPFIRPE
ncbi:uncharacterized protein [Pyrus communis]|uniref:uncharacterized protein n=1 Tax=Pyrus communis TaxID=23211 RepID=UPI0035BF9183